MQLENKTGFLSSPCYVRTEDLLTLIWPLLSFASATTDDQSTLLRKILNFQIILIYPSITLARVDPASWFSSILFQSQIKYLNYYYVRTEDFLKQF